MTITQDMVDEIVRRAKASAMGLGKPEKGEHSYDFSAYGTKDFGDLALMLVSAHFEKYDIVSIVAAALEVVAEKAAAEALQKTDNALKN